MPTRHREVLGANFADGALQLTITRHPHGCLMVFPRAEWSTFAKRLENVPGNQQDLKRLFLGYAMDVEIDGTGRVLISPELREAAGISKEVTLLGMGRHLELWDTQRHKTREAQELQSSIPRAFEDFSY